MANRIDLDKKATDYLKGALGGKSGGGLVLVDTLPDKGNEDTLYKLPDGTIWSCVNKTITDEFKVGGTYKVANTVKQSLINKLTKNFTLEQVWYIESYGTYPSIYVYSDTTVEPNVNTISIRTNRGNAVFNGNSNNSDNTDIEVVFEDISDTPTLTIGQEFVGLIEVDGFELSDFEPLFILETHDVCEWTEVGSSGGSNVKTYQYQFSLHGRTVVFTFTASDFVAPTENITLENSIGAFIGDTNRMVNGIDFISNDSSQYCYPCIAYKDNGTLTLIEDGQIITDPLTYLDSEIW